MTKKTMQHVLATVRKGLGPSRCTEHEARAYWRHLDDYDRFRIGQDLDLHGEAEFIQACLAEAEAVRSRRAEEFTGSHDVIR